MQSFPENAQISGGQKIQFSSTVSSRLCTGLFSFIMRNFSEMFLSPQSELEFSHGQDPKQAIKDVRSTSALGRQSGLVLLALSSSGCDPGRTARCLWNQRPQ